ncbi:PQQ-binding-like beta-propeller repeat protein [Micromonospora sp. SL4-19]|uniref:outer membrane protein assembly factor BamB family protein n=1 Tax=Micromonospora sp. SL4-19 TaxID=3399129 RepID=UPI003A4DE265
MSRVIELGELRHGDEPEPPPQGRRPPSRAARVVALCCAALLTLAGAAPAPRRPPGVTVPAAQAAGFLVVADRLVVADGPVPRGPGGRLVTGHRLPDGAPMWRFTLPVDHQVAGLNVVAGVLLVTSIPVGGDSVSTALDPRDGAVRWQRPGYPLPTQPGGLLFETSTADGTGTIGAVDPATGAERWSLPVPNTGLVYQFGDRGMTDIVLLTDDGRVAVHDVGFGALRRSGRVPPAADGMPYRLTQAVADLLLIDDGRGTATAYGLDRFDRRWTMPVQPESRASWFLDCAPVICLGQEEAGIRTYDPATGRPLWSDEHRFLVGRVGDRLLAFAGAPGQEVELVVLDPWTGRVLARLGRWRMGGGDPYTHRLLGYHRLPGDRTLVAELDVPTGQVRIRAVLPGAWNECADGGDVLVCQQHSRGLVIWPTGT